MFGFFQLRIAWLLCALLLSVQAQARPMGFKQSWMLMGDLSPDEQMLLLNYAVTAKDAVGVGVQRMRPDDKRFTHDEASVNYTRLLHRWNLPDAQANLWFVGAVGAVRGDDFSGTKTLIAPAVMFDYETTRLYFSAEAKLYRAGNIHHDAVSAKAGFSFYEVNYDETQPWLIVQAKRTQQLSDKTEITPSLRLIHKNIFVDIGVNNSRKAKLSFMYIF
jgi:hypothetical protein